MIIIKVIGGLGNQMFQYALYKKLKARGRNVKLDISDFKNYEKHNGYEIEEAFNITSSDIANAKDLNKYKQTSNVFTKLKVKLLELVKIIYFDQEKEFDEKVIEKKIGYLNGYWQSEKYFNDIGDEIKKSFQFNLKTMDELNYTTRQEILNSDSIAVHVRRGDYLENEKNKLIYGEICNNLYYEKAIKKIELHVKNAKFFVFSDDIEWVKENLKIPNAKYVNFNFHEKSFLDMYLMSLCKHNIIANSTFSWWGAWLNSNPSKIVIAPEKWVNEPGKSPADIIPLSWVKISNKF